MGPEKARQEQKDVLEHDITEGLRRKKEAEAIDDPMFAELHEVDMNEALQEYKDLMRAIGRIANEQTTQV